MVSFPAAALRARHGGAVRRVRPIVTVIVPVALAAACSAPGTDSSMPLPGESVAPAPGPSSAGADSLAGMTVAIDPGHNGDNADHPGEIGAPVPDGRDGTKACNTTGARTHAGYPEHAFTWQVGTLVREDIEELGARVVMSRDDDSGVGPCVDERGQFAGAAGADVLVSIHANGTEDPTAAGFHVITVEDSPHPDVEAPSRSLATDMVSAFEDAAFAANPAYGDDGIVARTDIAGLNHAEVPAVLVECGEMGNPQDAQRMESEEGRQQYAAAIVDGIEEHLTR